MGLESTTNIDGLVPTNPEEADLISEADDHIRLLKTVLQTMFPNGTNPFTVSFDGSGNATFEGTVTIPDTDSYRWGDGNERIVANNAGTMNIIVNSATAQSFDSSGNATFAGDVTVTGDITVDSIVQPKVKIIDIGDWDMDATASVDVPHDLTLADIRSISVLIRNDADSLYSPLDVIADVVGFFNASSVNVTLTRAPFPGFYDSVNYNATGYNRGWITITYV